MDTSGWSATRRARKEAEAFLSPQRDEHGAYTPVEQANPLDELSIGGFHLRKPEDGPPVPHKDAKFTHHTPISTISPAELRTKTPLERSSILRVARMEPHLQFMVGPLLRYDTVDPEGVWHGAALIVSADSSSDYDPFPIMTYSWDPENKSGYKPNLDMSMPHPADLNNATVFPAPHDAQIQLQVNGEAPPPQNGNGDTESSIRVEHCTGQEIWVYGGNGGSYTFWRFMIHIPLAEKQMRVSYSINNGQKLDFHVPGRNQNFRAASHSCNGFSSGVNQDDFRGPGFQSGYDPLWVDMLEKHAKEPYHVLIGGGDQLYCDALTREPEMQDWNNSEPEARKTYVLTDEIKDAVDRFYFNHYCQAFRSGAFARANCSIPMVNMTDDHDLIDGFGSYPEDLQMAPVFRHIGSRGYFFFLLFQCFLEVDVDGLDDTIGKYNHRALVFGGQGPYVPFLSHNIVTYLGPQQALLMLDGRAERKKDQVCSPEQYDKVFARMEQVIVPTTEHLIVQLGVPIAYPRMVFLENMLESKVVSRIGRGLPGFVNKFNADAELLDDLNDHWCARTHKKERNDFVKRLQDFALRKNIRISFLSGDVHAAAVGLFKTLINKKDKPIEPANDYRYMLGVTTSAIVNTPPPNPVITLVNSLAAKRHKTLHHASTDEVMLPIFDKDTDGSIKKSGKYVMGRRNWCSSEVDPSTGELIWDLRIEKGKGLGDSVGYSVRAPPPRWGATATPTPAPAPDAVPNGHENIDFSVESA